MTFGRNIEQTYSHNMQDLICFFPLFVLPNSGTFAVIIITISTTILQKTETKCAYCVKQAIDRN